MQCGAPNGLVGPCCRASDRHLPMSPQGAGLEELGACYHPEPPGADGELRLLRHTPGCSAGQLLHGHGNSSDWSGGGAVCGHRSHHLPPVLFQL